MAISRSLMNRQLQANGGIMDVSPREKFGLGSSLKKFVSKINSYVKKIDESVNNFRLNVSVALFYEIFRYLKDIVDHPNLKQNFYI